MSEAWQSSKEQQEPIASERAPEAATPSSLERRMEAAIRENTRRFDIASLLAALADLGYGEGEIELRSNLTTLHHGNLVESVEFVRSPRRAAVVTVNVGLLASQSPLPSYFFQVQERQTQEMLLAYLNFFGHSLLKGEFAGQYPERDGSLFPDILQTRRDLMAMLGLRSPSTLHWMFSHCFPELEVAVRRGTHLHTVPTKGVRLAATVFGDGSAFGAVTCVPVPSVTVLLFCEEALSGQGVPWAKEAARRMRAWIFPRLIDQGLFLTVVLIFRDQPSWTLLQPDRFLGYQPIYDPKLKYEKRQSRQVVLFDNEVSRSALETKPTKDTAR